MQNRKFNLLLLIFSSLYSFSQSIVDDSTVANISYSQTKYFTKQDVFVGDSIRRGINNEERFDFFQYSFSDSNLVQDLGMYGSAGFSWYEPYNKNLGNYDGISVYNHLAYQDKNVKYYDTKVPYSFMEYRQIFGGTRYFNGGYTQSMGKVFNLGMEIKRFNTPLNFGSNPNNVTYLDNISSLVHASFITPNNKYKALINYRFMNQSVSENGGVFFENKLVDTDSILAETYIRPSLTTSALSQEKRNEWSFYQEASPFKDGQVKLFHSLDRTKKVNRYEDKALKSNASYYNAFYLDSVATKDSNVYRVIENKIGLSGRFNQVSYAGYVKNRLWKYESDTNLWDTASVKVKRVNDLYFGGDLFYQTKARDVNAKLSLELGADGTHKYDFVSDFKYVKLKYLDLKNLASLRQTNYQENNSSWSNSFTPYTLREMRLEPYYRGKKFYVSAFWSKQEYNGFVYYNSSNKPVQDTVSREGQLYGFTGRLKLKKWSVNEFIQLADVSKIPFMSVPEIYNHTSVAYSFQLKKLTSLKIKIGADAYYFSSYKPMKYRSDLQSFTLQDDFTQKAYTIVDLFCNIKYKTVDFSLKGTNLLQGLGANGFYPTYGYIGRKRGVELGLRWSFFR